MNIERHEIYYCLVCGAELVVVKGKGGEAELFCCNTEMIKREQKAKAFVCDICGSELIWTFESGVIPELNCCNEPMRQI
jgi:predicted RNA-binding Zn-ribbon protein involved in translation (DUF1610 family)